jgi:hypothetical protein
MCGPIGVRCPIWRRYPTLVISVGCAISWSRSWRWRCAWSWPGPGRSLTAIGEWAADAPAGVLYALGVRADPWRALQPVAASEAASAEELLRAIHDAAEGHVAILAALPDATLQERAADVRRPWVLDLPDTTPLLADGHAGPVVADPPDDEIAWADKAAVPRQTAPPAVRRQTGGRRPPLTTRRSPCCATSPPTPRSETR